jgi:hypothetical protein
MQSISYHKDFCVLGEAVHPFPQALAAKELSSYAVWVFVVVLPMSTLALPSVVDQERL